MTKAPKVLLGLLLTLLACEGRPRMEDGEGASSDLRASGPAIAVLDLSEGVPEHVPGALLPFSSKAASLEDLVRESERLEHDDQVRGVLVRFGTARLGLGRASEVGSILATLNAKKPTFCHADDYGNGTLYVASVGCRRVWVAPATSVDAVGLAAQTMYFHKLLTEELGLDVDFLQVGKFKGAEEPFTRDGPSAEARESLQSTLQDLRATWIGGILKHRDQAADSAPEDGPYSAQEAKARGLVDEVGYADEARSALEKAAGATRSEVRLGPGGNGEGDFADVLRLLTGEMVASTPVVVVMATGAISMEDGNLLGDGGIVESRLVGILRKLERDDDVRAVVLRIDSPGGSALASDLIWHALMRLRAKKTLVVSIGDMAASGGYYLASSGAVVFADATSIVGSIGVVGGKIAADHALGRVGVHAETFPAKPDDPRAASRAAYESLLLPWDEPTRARVLGTMTGIYQLFLQRVGEGRKLSPERVEASAEGRIFSGREGKSRGLVDELGGLKEAIARARAMAGLAPDAKVSVAGEGSGLMQALSLDEPRRSASRTPIGRELLRSEPEAIAFVDSLVPIMRREPAVCVLPFALAIR